MRIGYALSLRRLLHRNRIRDRPRGLRERVRGAGRLLSGERLQRLRPPPVDVSLTERPRQSGFAPKVSQLAIAPEAYPRSNHRLRCAELPCVKVSGRTTPPEPPCRASSPMASAARKASSRSPTSSSCRRSAWWAHTPA